MTLLSLPLWIAGLAGAHHLIVMILRGTILIVRPLTGDKDAVVYHRSIFTPGSHEVLALWALLIASGAMWWIWLTLDYPSLNAPAIVIFGVSVGWELWTWERVAASTRYVAWRRGWQQGTRRVHIKSMRDVRVSEKQPGLVLGRWVHSACRLTVILRNGKTARLPTTSTLASLHEVEGTMDFLRLQLEEADKIRRRMAATARQAEGSVKAAELSTEEQELRQRLATLRRAKAAQAAKNGSKTSVSPPPVTTPPTSTNPSSHKSSRRIRT